jgi:hypothetical protein
MFWTCIQHIPSSYLGLCAGWPVWSVRGFLHPFQTYAGMLPPLGGDRLLPIFFILLFINWVVNKSWYSHYLSCFPRSCPFHSVFRPIILSIMPCGWPTVSSIASNTKSSVYLTVRNTCPSIFNSPDPSKEGTRCKSWIKSATRKTQKQGEIFPHPHGVRFWEVLYERLPGIKFGLRLFICAVTKILVCMPTVCVVSFPAV